MSATTSALKVLAPNIAVTTVFGIILTRLLGTARTVTVTTYIFGVVFIGFGVNIILSPASGLSFFQWDYPIDPTARELIDKIMLIYGARDIFMGVAMWIAAALGNRKVAGATLIAASAVAAVDGFACMNGEAEWGHWGYAPVLTVIGALIIRS